MNKDNVRENIILFSRCELVYLYGEISKYLIKKYNVIHVAYSDKEESILREKYSITEIINFRKETQKILTKEKFDSELCNFIDQSIIEQSNNRFNLNSAIQYDRTFQNLSYEECLILSQTYYKFWHALISQKNIKYLLHELVSLYFNHIAFIICKNHSAKYIAQIQVYGESTNNFLIVSADDGISEEINHNKNNQTLSIEEKNRVNKFLLEFRSDENTFFNSLSTKHNFLNNIKVSSKLAISVIKNKFLLWLKNYQLPIDHLEIALFKEVSFVREMKRKWGMFFYLKYDEYNPKLKYYYYPIHLEPEAVVLYWGDGIYKNQIKLIENIAAQLPPDCYLFVKEHPHAGTYRDLDDYNKIKAIPNIKLLNPKVPGKNITRNSIGVITISGTSGFEALLMNKQVYTFGNAFYNQCKRVINVKNIRDLRNILYSNYNTKFKDDDDLYGFVYGYLQSAHPGFVNYFLNYNEIMGIDDEKNIKMVADGLNEYFEKCRNEDHGY